MVRRLTKFIGWPSGRIPIRSSPASSEMQSPSKPLSAWPLSMHHLPGPLAPAFVARGRPVPVNFPCTTTLFSYFFVGSVLISTIKERRTAERESRLWIIEISNDILYPLMILAHPIPPSPISFLSGSREKEA